MPMLAPIQYSRPPIVNGCASSCWILAAIAESALSLADVGHEQQELVAADARDDVGARA